MSLWGTSALPKVPIVVRLCQHCHCIEFAQGFWAGWQYWKNKFGSIMSNFWGQFFHVFVGKKELFFSKKYCIVCTKKLHILYSLNFFWIFFWLKIGKIFTINCVLLNWRYLPAQLLYSDFGWNKSVLVN